jgi:hypothetical protein
MDLELLNFWINRLNFDFRRKQLFVILPAHERDPGHCYCLLLSDDPDKILTFFGFDTSINYDKLSLNNQFEYLCTSTKLDPKFIDYCGFKGPTPKNRIHSKFDIYLKSKNYPKSMKYQDNSEILADQLLKEAIIFFDKSNEYESYKQQFTLLNNLMKQKRKLPDNYDFNRFCLLHNIYTIINFDSSE